MAKNTDLSTLIRLRRWGVDERRRDLALLYSQASEIDARAEALVGELGREQQAAAGETDFGFTYSAYGRRVIERRNQMAEEKAEIEDQITAAQERVAEAYRDLKSLEQVQDNRARAAEEELKRTEQAGLNEIASRRHFRDSEF